jgi:hypothetical protein
MNAPFETHPRFAPLVQRGFNPTPLPDGHPDRPLDLVLEAALVRKLGTFRAHLEVNRRRLNDRDYGRRERLLMLNRRLGVPLTIRDLK